MMGKARKARKGRIARRDEAAVHDKAAGRDEAAVRDEAAGYDEAAGRDEAVGRDGAVGHDGAVGRDGAGRRGDDAEGHDAAQDGTGEDAAGSEPSSLDWRKDDEMLALVGSSPVTSPGGQVIQRNGITFDDIKHLQGQVRRAWTAAGLMALGLIVVGIGFLNYPKYRVIATTDNQAICEVPTEERPRMTKEAVIQWAADAVVELYSYDYVNYRRSLNNAARKWLSTEGQKSFFRTLDGSHNLRLVRDERLIMKAALIEVPQAEFEGNLPTKPYMEVRVPVRIEFYANGNRTPAGSSTHIARVQVVQTQANAYNRRGLAIDEIFLYPYSEKKG